jgi:hypothetical protein
MPPARQAAWDAYLAVTTGLLPAVVDECAYGPAVNAKLGGVVIRINRYAPMWGEHGPMLAAAARSAVRVYRTGNRDDLTGLLLTIAGRLYALSIPPGTGPRDRNDRR